MKNEKCSKSTNKVPTKFKESSNKVMSLDVPSRSIGIKMEHSVEQHSETMKLTNPSSATTVAPFKGRKKSPGVLEM